MHRIAILNQKGGSGKTTTAVNLAAALAEHGVPVLVVDLDPSAHATNWLDCTDTGKGLYEAFTEKQPLQAVVWHTANPNLDLIPSSRAWLSHVERVLVGSLTPYAVLKDRLDELQGPWRYIFLDCPPNLGTLSLNALAAARELYVPVVPGSMELDGFKELLNTLQEIHAAALNPNLELTGVLLCRHDARTRLARGVLDMLRSHFEGKVFNTIIRETVRLSEAPGHCKTILAYAPDSTGAADYRALASEVMARHGDAQ